MSSSSPAQFKGIGPKTEEEGKKLQLEEFSFTPQKWTEDYVDVKVETCGICATDVHLITHGWPAPVHYPMVPGHEVVGTVVRAGEKSGHKVGARVGIGYQSGSCLHCKFCDKHEEQFCTSMVPTFEGKWPDGTISHGGYADYIRSEGRFAIPIPDNVPSEIASPLLCAGVTVYSPLKRFGAGPGKKVGIVGIGGLGHIALQISVALGADTYAISQTDSKKSLCDELGVPPKNFIATKGHESEVTKEYSRFFDLVIVTATGSAPPLEELYFPMMAPRGAVVLCGIPDEKMEAMHGSSLVGKSLTLAGSLIGGTDELHEVIHLASEGKVKPIIQVRPMSDVQQAVRDLNQGKARFRYVLKRDN